MPRLALALFALYAALAFGWRSWQQLRTTGRSGFVGLSRGGAKERAGGLLLAIALGCGVAAPLAALRGWPLGAPLARELPVLGVALFAAGLALTLAAQVQMGASWRIGVDPSERTALVTAGAFRFARNPIYTGMIAIALGLAALVPNAWSALAALALVVGLELHVRFVEEPYLLGMHGDAYRRWAGRTGRFLPGLGRLR